MDREQAVKNARLPKRKKEYMSVCGCLCRNTAGSESDELGEEVRRQCVESSCPVVSVVVCVGAWWGWGWVPSCLHGFNSDGFLENSGGSTVGTDFISKAGAQA